MNIGFRANEANRAESMKNRCNKDGYLEHKNIVGTHQKGRHKGKNKWAFTPWQIPNFPLIEHGIFKDQIENYWEGQNVRFALLNNCVGCFHRNPILLRKMYEIEPKKMEWFSNQEGGENGHWRGDLTYKQILKHKLQVELFFSDFSTCDSGYCHL